MLQADQIIINAGGTLSVISGKILTIADGTDAVDCNVNGTLYNAGTVTPTGAIAFNSGSTYQHAQNGGTIPFASWNTASTCYITGITSTAPTAGLNQTFYNLPGIVPTRQKMLI